MIKRKGPIEYMTSSILESERLITHSFLTRKGGGSPIPFSSLNFFPGEGDDLENINFHKRLVGESFGFSPSSLIILNQVHGKKVIVLDKPKEKILSSLALKGDAMVTNRRGLVLGILTADCLPILIMEASKGVIGAVHTGWMGTKLKVVQRTLLTMERVFGIKREKVRVAMGPSIGTCCYEVDEKVLISMRRALPGGMIHVGDRRLDLIEINRKLLMEVGVKKDSIETINLCTSCRDDLFFSYRRDGRTGRQLSFIKLN